MQIEDSSLIGIIELESPTPCEFETLLNPGSEFADKFTHRHRHSPAARWTEKCSPRPAHDAATPEVARDESSVIAVRFPRPDRPTASAVAADLSRLEDELLSELQQLRRRMNRQRR